MAARPEVLRGLFHILFRDLPEPRRGGPARDPVVSDRLRKIHDILSSPDKLELLQREYFGAFPDAETADGVNTPVTLSVGFDDGPKRCPDGTIAPKTGDCNRHGPAQDPKVQHMQGVLRDIYQDHHKGGQSVQGLTHSVADALSTMKPQDIGDLMTVLKLAPTTNYKEAADTIAKAMAAKPPSKPGQPAAPQPPAQQQPAQQPPAQPMHPVVQKVYTALKGVGDNYRKGGVTGGHLAGNVARVLGHLSDDGVQELVKAAGVQANSRPEAVNAIAQAIAKTVPTVPGADGATPAQQNGHGQQPTGAQNQAPGATPAQQSPPLVNPVGTNRDRNAKPAGPAQQPDASQRSAPKNWGNVGPAGGRQRIDYDALLNGRATSPKAAKLQKRIGHYAKPVQKKILQSMKGVKQFAKQAKKAAKFAAKGKPLSGKGIGTLARIVGVAYATSTKMLPGVLKAVGAAAGLPIGGLNFLGASKNPKAGGIFRKALQMLTGSQPRRRRRPAGPVKFAGDDVTAAASDLAARLAAHEGAGTDDIYAALVMAALDKTHDLNAAVDMADQAADALPKPAAKV
jgi:hypothetical protein